jgi:hypothetical protein
MSDFLLESLGKIHERAEEVLATPTRNAPTVWRSDGVHARLGSGAVYLYIVLMGHRNDRAFRPERRELREAAWRTTENGRTSLRP